MKRDVQLESLLLSMLGVAICSACCGAEWITAPSYYTHDPQTGQRVDQYTPIGPFYTFARTDYLQSGYRHTRSSIQAGTSMDHLHIVEEWGRPVRPYGEWRFPYRPYSVPYALWGPPFAGLGYPVPYGPYYGPVGPGPGGPDAAGQMGPSGEPVSPPQADDYYDPYHARQRDARSGPGPGSGPGRGPGAGRGAGPAPSPRDR